MNVSKTNILRKPAMMLAISASFAYPLHVQADINKEMASMFNSMGSEANVTEAGSFHGQAGSLYSGGSFSVRTPSSNLNPANIQLPTMSAGCGGIDFFGGAFSFANKEQFIAFTRNLGNQAAGVAFDLALKALDPMIQDAIGGIRDMVNFINQQNLASCEAAKQVAGGAMGLLSTSIDSGCQATAVGRGSADDGSDARWICKFATNLEKEVNAMRGSGKPQDTIDFTGGNLAYKSFTKSYNSLSDSNIDLFTSITGTVIFVPLTKVSNDEVQVGVQFYPATITSASDLLNGNSGNTTATPKIKVNLIQCRNGSKNLREKCQIVENASVDSIKYKVAQLLQKLPQMVRSNSAWSASELQDMQVLLSNSSLPLLKMGVSDGYLGTNDVNKPAVIEFVAIEFAAGLLQRYERDLYAAIAKYDKLDTIGSAEKEKMLQNLTSMRQMLMDEKRDALRKINVEKAYANALKNYDDQWRSNFVGVAHSLDFDRMNRF